jgi:hypothetical protein
MSPIKFEELAFDHIVEFTKDDTIFAAARENGTGHLRLFLINQSTGNVYTRNGRADSWEELYGRDRDSIIARITAARNNHIPVYKINGSHNT